ncbi:MAG: DUF3102 domain-containing protein [Leptospiraceae bacterium]|nr:DUF3102 domain-containing protein [Leptospiraceae bacterium]
MINKNKTIDIAIEPEILNNKAIELREKRENTFIRGCLTAEQKNKYLDSIKEELQIRCTGLKHQIYEIGKLLYEAKRLLPHGKFKQWINENFELCYRTAHNLVRVYIVCMGHPEMVKYFKPSSLYVIARPDFPGNLRDSLFEGIKGPVDIKEKDLIKLALDFKNGLFEITDPKVQDLLKKRSDISLWEQYKTELEALKVLIANRLEKIERLPTIHSDNFLIEEESMEEYAFRAEEQSKIENVLKKHKTEIDEMIKELDEKCK